MPIALFLQNIMPHQYQILHRTKCVSPHQYQNCVYAPEPNVTQTLVQNKHVYTITAMNYGLLETMVGQVLVQY